MGESRGGPASGAKGRAMALIRRGSRAGEGTAAPGGERVLELRVHGVNNTPPAGMLELDPQDVEKARGDSLGSFWTPSAAALEHARAVPPSHHDHIPADVRREAYSWGLMARTTPTLPGSPTIAAVTAASRAGWMLLLPLGLANVAYWSRRLLGPGRYGRGARSVRVFGLALSLLVVTAAAAVALDVVGTQCFGADGVVCSNLPTWATWLGELSWSERLVVLSAVPVGALLVLSWLATGSRVKYEHVTSAPVRPAPTPAESRRPAPLGAAEAPVLSRPGLWSRWVLARAMGNLHVAGGLALVSLTLTWSQVYGAFEVCRSPVSLVTEPICGLAREGALRSQPVLSGLLTGAVVLLALVVVMVARSRVELMPTSPGRARSAPAALALLAGVLLFGATAVALLVFGQAEVPTLDGYPVGLVGLSITPGLIVAVLLVIALAGLTWRRGPLGLVWIALALGLTAALVLAAGSVAGEGGHGALVAAVAVMAVLVLVSAIPRRQRAASLPLREQAWAGAAPGVFLLLSAGFAMVLAGLLVVVVGDWLNGGSPAPCLVLPPAEQAAEAMCAVPGAAAITVPATYAEFGVAAFVALALVVVVVLGAAALGLARLWWLEGESIPDARPGAPAPSVAEAAVRAAEVPAPAGIPAALLQRVDLRSAVTATRRRVALLHRGELGAGLIAGGFAVALAGSLFVSVDARSSGWVLPREITNLGLWTLALLWTLVLARVVVGGGTQQRPLGLMWDLMCFLPRSAHPFGPPCYAERAVPEIAARVDAWLRGDDLPTPARERSRAEQRAVEDRRVVLSAHSLGAVLAVAALFTQDTAGERHAERPGRVALLTYGTQVRAYFGRMFPELLGPQVLGTAGSRRSAVLGRDPWRLEVARPPGVPVPGAVAFDDCLVRRLGGRPGRLPAWVSLWRRTDPLGFPVASFADNEVDRAAEEIDPTGFVAQVAGHSGYPRTAAYRAGLAEVVERLDRP